MSVVLPHQIEDDFTIIDADRSWEDDEPSFEWTEDDRLEFEKEELKRLAFENEQEGLAWLWEVEGVRCWTFGPPRNPYR